MPRSHSSTVKSQKRPLQLVARDYTVLASIVEYRMLSTEQVYRLHFPSLGRTRKRLHRLRQHGYVHRLVRPVRLGEGSSQYFYALTRKGRGLLQVTRPDLPLATLYRRSTEVIGQHAERINEFRICLRLAAANVQAMTVVWRGGSEFVMMTEVAIGRIRTPMTIIPDGWFSIRAEKREYSYFLEIDRGTTDLRRIAAKVATYLQLWHSRYPQRKFSIRSFRVLFVTTSATRLRHMLDAIRAMQGKYPRLDLVLLATSNAYSLAEPVKLLSSMWQYIGHDGTARTSSLLPSSIPPTLPTSPGKPPVRSPDAGC